MDAAKIQLSTDELQLVQNANFLLTKNRIIQKAMELFGEIAHETRDFLEASPGLLPPGVLQVSPKISKGENHHGLPYVVLDYPRYFSKEQVLAIRSFFWWGNFFSTTLHLKGDYHQRYREAILAGADQLAAGGFHICIAAEEWRHDFDGDNYVPLAQLPHASLEELLTKKDFCKLSAKISLSQWNESKKQLLAFYTQLFTVLGYQLPRR